MKCLHCGANIPDDQVICPECGAEVQIVPDYNPLEDVLAREVKGSVEGATRQIRSGDIRRYNRRGTPVQSVNSTRVMSQGELDRIRDERQNMNRRTGEQNRAGGRSTGGVRSTGRTSGSTGGLRGEERSSRNVEKLRNIGSGSRTAAGTRSGGSARNTGNVRPNREQTGRQRDDRRRQQQLKKREAAKKRRRNLLITLFLLLALIGVGIYVAYQNSYTGVMKKGYSALQAGNYEQAESYFNRAIVKDKSRAEAYTGLSEIYIEQNDLDSAESVFLSALGSQPTNADLYQAAIDFYMDTEQLEKISPLLADCEDETVLNAVSDYVSAAPSFSLEGGTYSEVQEVTISSSTGGTIYYTTDGTDPTASSEEYREPILLQNEGEVVIKAIAINDKEIPSIVSSAKYTIEFPIASAPAVNPATGQYTEPTQITITVPDGYTAYYTMDGTTPTSDSERYTGPVDMPENSQIIFNAVLINNNNGKATDVTTRNYITRAE